MTQPEDQQRGSQPEEEAFRLSRPEHAAHDAAVRIAGGAKQQSTQKSLASIVLGFELFVVFLAGLTVFGLRLTDPPELGIWGGVALCLVIVCALGVMRRGKIGLWLGWAVHVLYFAAGFVLPAIIFIALIFTGLWVYCMVKGAQIDRDRAALVAAHDGQ